KVPLQDGRYKYSLPADQRFNPLQKLQRALSDAFISIDGASHFLVLKALPGNANAIAALIDRLEWHEILGTISGDDTILIICRTESDREERVDELHRTVDIHGQHENQELMDEKQHIRLLDYYASNDITSVKEEYLYAYQTYRQLKKELAQLNIDEKRTNQRIDLYQFQIREIEEAKLQIGEEEALTEER
ncbi:hypothetical protein RhiirA1_483742, partial [Rhizophagus irregularis]